MMLVGDVADRTAILIDDLADTCNTITRAAKLLKKEHATKVYALITHGVFSGDAIERLKASALDTVVTTNSVDQREHKALLGDQLHVLEVGHVFAEVGTATLIQVVSLLTCRRLFVECTMVRASAFCSTMIRLWIEARLRANGE
jgi:phosphoribosylpyrophosphate synthetase